jgi:hypothetical protein
VSAADHADFDTELIGALCDKHRAELPEGTAWIDSPIVTIAGEVRISNQLLSGRFESRPLRGAARARFWLRHRATRSRERIALWIAPWLWDD